MGLLDRLFRRGRQQDSYASSEQGWSGAQVPQPPPPASAGASGPDPQGDDARAIERYRYLLRTAPPEQIEQAHAEAFAALTPSQRQEVLQSLSEQTPSAERSTSDDPRSLARMATCAEMRQPGTLERSFGGGSFGPGSVGRPGIGLGGVIGGSLLGSVAGAFIGTAIAEELFGPDPADLDAAGPADDETRYGNEDGADTGGDTGDGSGDYGGGDYASGDLGGGDFGGGDFGGGDF